MSWEKQEENSQFVAWGKEKARENSFVIEQGKTLEGVIEQIKPSEKGYKYIYQIRSKGVEPTLIVLGSTDLNNKLGYGQTAVKRVVEGDTIRITFKGMTPTKKGKQMYIFDVAVQRTTKQKA